MYIKIKTPTIQYIKTMQSLALKLRRKIFLLFDYRSQYQMYFVTQIRFVM